MPSILIAFPITTFCLGTWQLYRLKEKTELIKTLNSNLSNDPIDISRPNNSKIGDKVLITGAFLDSQFHVGPRSYPSSPSGSIFSSSVNSHGYFVISPFQMKNGPLILVNRGWIPSDIKESFKNRWSFGELSLVGLIKNSEKAFIF